MIKIRALGYKNNTDKVSKNTIELITSHTDRELRKSGYKADVYAEGHTVIISNISKPTGQRKNPLTRPEVEALTKIMEKHLTEFYYNTQLDIKTDYKEE